MCAGYRPLLSRPALRTFSFAQPSRGDEEAAADEPCDPPELLAAALPALPALPVLLAPALLLAVADEPDLPLPERALDVASPGNCAGNCVEPDKRPSGPTVTELDKPPGPVVTVLD